MEAKERIGALIICSISAASLQLAAYFKRTYFYGWWLFLFLTIIFALWVAYHERGREFCFIHFAVAFMSGILIPLCLSSLVIIRRVRTACCAHLFRLGRHLYAMRRPFTGMALGRHKLAPRTSPKKPLRVCWAVLRFCDIYDSIWYHYHKYCGLNGQFYEADCNGSGLRSIYPAWRFGLFIDKENLKSRITAPFCPDTAEPLTALTAWLPLRPQLC